MKEQHFITLPLGHLGLGWCLVEVIFLEGLDLQMITVFKLLSGSVYLK
jgi:hypothetical protein